MIFEALELIRAELQTYVQPFSATMQVELGSIANTAGSQHDKILLSLINLEEETALRNLPPPYQRNAAGNFERRQPPVFLNLYMLICANYHDNTTYRSALQWLSRVVQCFQRKNVFTVANTPDAISLPSEAASLQVSMEIYSLTFEKLNQLWGTLGGKQVPFVVYKVRVVEEQVEEFMGEGAAILTIEGRGTPVISSPN
jgi:hypothetical protein